MCICGCVYIYDCIHAMLLGNRCLHIQWEQNILTGLEGLFIDRVGFSLLIFLGAVISNVCNLTNLFLCHRSFYCIHDVFMQHSPREFLQMELCT